MVHPTTNQTTGFERFGFRGSERGAPLTHFLGRASLATTSIGTRDFNHRG